MVKAGRTGLVPVSPAHLGQEPLERVRRPLQIGENLEVDQPRQIIHLKPSIPPGKLVSSQTKKRLSTGLQEGVLDAERKGTSVGIALIIP